MLTFYIYVMKCINLLGTLQSNMQNILAPKYIYIIIYNISYIIIYTHTHNYKLYFTILYI